MKYRRAPINSIYIFFMMVFAPAPAHINRRSENQTFYEVSGDRLFAQILKIEPYTMLLKTTALVTLFSFPVRADNTPNLCSGDITNLQRIRPSATGVQNIPSKLFCSTNSTLLITIRSRYTNLLNRRTQFSLFMSMLYIFIIFL